MGGRFCQLAPDEIRAIRESLGMNYGEFGRALGLYSGTPPRKWENGLAVPYQVYVDKMLELKERLRKQYCRQTAGKAVLRKRAQ